MSKSAFEQANKIISEQSKATDEALAKLEEKLMIKKILHYLPFVHFYKPWVDTTAGMHTWQHAHCEICNHVKSRLD